MHYFGNPGHTQYLIVYMILTEYFWRFQRKIALLECPIMHPKHTESLSQATFMHSIMNNEVNMPYLPCSLHLKLFALCFVVCWSTDPKERPLFSEIITHLEEIRDSSFIGTQQDEFMTLQNDWRIEIEEMFNELKEKEQVQYHSLCSSSEFSSRISILFQVLR